MVAADGKKTIAAWYTIDNGNTATGRSAMTSSA